MWFIKTIATKGSEENSNFLGFFVKHFISSTFIDQHLKLMRNKQKIAKKTNLEMLKDFKYEQHG